MADWETYKGVEIPEATPTGAAGLRLKDNFIYVADQLDTLGTKALTVTSKTSNYTAAPGDLVYCDVSGGSFTVRFIASGNNECPHRRQVGHRLGQQYRHHFARWNRRDRPSVECRPLCAKRLHRDSRRCGQWAVDHHPRWHSAAQGEDA